MMIAGGRWPITKLKRVTYRIAGGTPESDNEAYWCDPTDESATAWVAIGDMSQRQVVTSTTRAVTSAGLTSKRLTVGRPGTVLLAMYASVGEVATLGVPAAWNQAILGLSGIRGALDTRYLGYLLRSMRPKLVGMTRSNTQDNLNAEQVGNLEVPCPPIGAQSAIADFLDRETANIDGLIEKQKQLVIGLLERRSAILDHLVLTLPVAAERLRRFADVTVGIVVTPSAWYADDGVVALRGVNVRPESLSLDDVVYLSEEGDALHEKSRLRKGDVVVVRTGQAGAACAVPPSLFGANAIDLLIVRCRAGVMPEYLAAVLNSGLIAEAVKTGSVGAIQGHFNVSALKDVMVPIPYLPTQRAFLSEWRIKSAQLDALVCKVERAVVIAQERRAALITEAVTGQLDLATGKVA